jgi:glycosyltransferase involved in cell wall biosynthesis
VHEVFTTEDAPLRVLGTLTRRSRDRVLVICPARDVAAAVRERFTGLAIEVMPYALTMPGDYLTDDERAAARPARTTRADDRPVAVLAGGWWPHKDPATVIEAFTRTRTRWRLLVAGHPIDHRLLSRLPGQPRLILHADDRDLEPEEMRRMYAAADVTIIARPPGNGKESGLLMDAVRHGIPAVISDHDPALAAQLRTQPWARLFRAGDPASLAGVLDETAGRIPPRPVPADAAVLGLATPQQALARFTRWHAALGGGTPA